MKINKYDGIASTIVLERYCNQNDMTKDTFMSEIQFAGLVVWLSSCCIAFAFQTMRGADCWGQTKLLYNRCFHKSFLSEYIKQLGPP